MASFTCTTALNLSWFGNHLVGAAGTIFTIADSLYDEFVADVVPNIKGSVTWIDAVAAVTDTGDPRTYGAIMGSVGSAQAVINLAALHSARDAITAQGYGEIVINGVLEVSGMCDFQNLGDTKISLRGKGSDVYASQIRLRTGSTPISYLFNLLGTRQFKILDLTIDANSIAKYALYCARNGVTTAGGHNFVRLFLIGGTIASHLNYASEDNNYVKVKFWRSPIGCIVTGYPVVADPSVVNASPADFTATWKDSTQSTFVDCHFGSDILAQPTPRAGLMLLGAQVNVYGGIIHTTPGGEAGVIVDSTHGMYTRFDGVNWDSGLPAICLKVGHYSGGIADTSLRANRMVVTGCDFTVDPTTGTNFLDAYALRESIFSGVHLVGLAVDWKFLLRDTQCTNNIFENCHFGDGTAVVITDAAAGTGNIFTSRGKVEFLTGSAGGVRPKVAHNSSFAGSVTVEGGVTLFPVTGTVPLRYLRSGTDTATLFSMTEAGIGGGNFAASLNWGDGTNAVDTTLYRKGADLLRTDDKLVATAGIGVGNAVAATTPGSVVKKMQIFDDSGNSLGYIPIYSAIT